MYRKPIYLSIILLWVISSLGVSIDTKYKKDEVFIKFAPKTGNKQRTKTECNQILASLNTGTIKRTSKLVPGLNLIKIPNSLTVEEAICKLQKRGEIIYAEPDYKIRLLSNYSNDSRFDELWGMHNIGQEGGVIDGDIDAPEAWDIITDSNVVVAVIDSGVDYTHPDLADNIWVNQAEMNGTSGVDDDGNGVFSVADEIFIKI